MEDTEDHLRGCGLLPLLLLLGGGVGGGGAGSIGCKTLSKNLTKGNNEATAPAVDGGELGNGKCTIAFAFGGGRIGNSFPPLPSASTLSGCPGPCPFRSAQSASSICKCSSAARRWAVEGNGAISWHSTQISYPNPLDGSFVGLYTNGSSGGADADVVLVVVVREVVREEEGSISSE
jgi:hypothetical protein